MTGWVYLPAVAIILANGLSWFLIGYVAADERGRDGWGVLFGLAGILWFGLVSYYAMVEGLV